MKKIYCINGSGKVGKDTFVEIAKYYFFIHSGLQTYNISSVDLVKEAAKLLQWDGVKNETGRQFLSDLKDLSTSVYDGPFKYMENEINSTKEGFIFLHIREPEEIKKVVDNFPESKTILIKRNNIEQFSNHADMNVENFNYDYVIDNNGTIYDYHITVLDFVKKELDFN